MTESEIKTIFFDIGNVLSGNFDKSLYRRFAEGMGVSYQELWQARKSHWIPFALGHLTEKEYWEGMQRDLKLPYSGSELCKLPYTGMRPLKGSIEIARELSGAYQLGIISNHANEWSDYIIETHGLDELFDPIIISSRVGMRKPGLGIYELALERAGAEAKNALFVDDKPENIAAARRLGMDGIVFESAGQLRRELHGRGLL